MHGVQVALNASTLVLVQSVAVTAIIVEHVSVCLAYATCMFNVSYTNCMFCGESFAGVKTRLCASRLDSHQGH